MNYHFYYIVYNSMFITKNSDIQIRNNLQNNYYVNKR